MPPSNDTELELQLFDNAPDIQAAGLRVAILAPLCPEGQVNLNSRWVEPFHKNGIDVEFIPVGSSDDQITAALARSHGVLLPGGNANVHPMFYDPLYEDDLSWPLRKDDLRDIERDKTAMQIAWKAKSLNIPTLGICRGMQEMIVAFGGRLEKLEDKGINHAAGYANDFNQNGCMEPEEIGHTVHDIHILDDRQLRNIFRRGVLHVNSVHGEGITILSWNKPENKTLRDTFSIEAIADDGVIEGISHGNMLGVQFHAEVEGEEPDNHRLLFGHFFDKMHAYKVEQDAAPILVIASGLKSEVG